MTPELMGAILLAGLPTSITCYYLCNNKFNCKELAIFGAAACMILGLVGGLVYSIPALLIFIAIANLVTPKKENSNLKTNNLESIEGNNQQSSAKTQEDNWENNFRKFKDEKLHSINSIKSYFSPLPENQEKLVDKIFENFLNSHYYPDSKHWPKNNLSIVSFKDDFYSEVRLCLNLLGLRSVALKELKEKSPSISSTVTKTEAISGATIISNQQHSTENRMKGPNSKIEEINKLISLKENGHITESEFQELKEEVFKKVS
jgi:hypothetical protein